MGLTGFVLRRKLSAFLVAIAAPAAMASIDGTHLSALPHAPGPRGGRTVEQAAIEHQPVCVGSSVASAGDLSDVLYYRAVALEDGHVDVGYFAFYSEERPWGNNWLTWSVVPALAVDLVYSRALLVAPGLQRALYGAGDVEGVGVVYDRTADGSLRFDHALADDGTHDAVALTRAQVFMIDHNRPTFYSEVWSHQARRPRCAFALGPGLRSLLRRRLDPPAPRGDRTRLPRRRRRSRAAGARRTKRRTAPRHDREPRRQRQRPSASARLTMCGVMKMMSSPRASAARRR